MGRRKWRRTFQIEPLESRQVLAAATTADRVELVASSSFYEDGSPIWQRTGLTPVVQNAQGAPAYDMRVNLPGDQTLRVLADDSTDPSQVSRLGQRLTRVLVDPQAVYEVNTLAGYESSQVSVEAYDILGRSLGKFYLGVDDDPRAKEQLSQASWHRGFLGNPQDRGAMSVQLPLSTYVIEIQTGSAATIGFIGDALEGGAEVVSWQDSPHFHSTRTADLVEGDQAYRMLPDKSYTFDASVDYQGTTLGVAHSVGYTAYDRDGQRIEARHVTRYGSASDTRLAQDLKPGDLFFDLVDASGWSNLAGPETRALAWYGYAGSNGQVYPDYTYTRNVASDVFGLWQIGDVVGNRITLRLPWNGPLVSAGTAVRNVVDEPGEPMFPVVASYQVAPLEAQATVSGTWKNGLSDATAFPPGTATFRPAAVLNQAISLNGVTRLEYRIKTSSLPDVTVNTNTHTRSITIDVLANDQVGNTVGTQLIGVSNPQYGAVQIVPATATAQAQVRYTTAAYFIGTDRFTYTVQLADGQLLTESVIVDSLGGNLEISPSLQQKLQQAGASPFAQIVEYGSSLVAISGTPVSSTADINNSMKIVLQPGSVVSYTLIKGVMHGSFKLNADGSHTYQSEPGFVGTDVFEYTVSNGARAIQRVGYVRVVPSVEEADRWRMYSITLAMHNYESTFKRLFYNSLPQYFDANGSPFVSWRVHILPFLGYNELYQQFRLNEPWDSPNNLPLLDQMPAIYRSAGDLGPINTTRFAAIKAGSSTSPTEHFLNDNGSPRNGRYSSIGHGPANALMFVRAGRDRAVPWSKPDDLSFDNANPLATLGTLTEDAIPVSFADSTTALMPKDILAATFTSIATVKATPGVNSLDGPTLKRTWSEKLNDARTHVQKYYAAQTENLRELGGVLNNYLDATRRFPSWGSTDTAGNRLLSWRVLLLQFHSDYAELFSRFHLNEPWDSPHNLSLLSEMPDIYRSATDSATSTTTRMRVLSGPGTLFDPALTRQLTIANITDGMSSTLFAIEAGIDKAVPWTMPETLTLGPDFLASVGQLPDGVIRGVLTDSSPFSLPTSAPNATLQAMATYRLGDLVNYTLPQVSPAEFNLRNLEQAIHYFESTYKRLPVNYWGNTLFTKKTTAPTLSWRVALLPFIDEQALYNQFHFDEPWDSPFNLPLLSQIPDVYRSAGLDPETGLTRMQMFSGARTLLRPDGTSVKLNEVTDGLSTTLHVVEAGVDKAVPWTKPSDLDGEAIDLWQALGLVGQTFTASLADGSVQSFTRSEQRYLNNKVIRNDGGSIDAFLSVDQLVMREGEILAFDLPTSVFTVENPTVVQMATASFAYPDYLSTGPTRVSIQAIDNGVADGYRVFKLHYTNRTLNVIIIDDEALRLTATPNILSEAGDRVTFTVTRPTIDPLFPLDVQVHSSNPARLQVPATVVIPAGQLSVTFEGRAIDSAQQGDTEVVRVTAAAYGMGVGMVNIKVVDDESLLLSFSPATISEAGGVTTGTLTRLGDLSQPVTVSLSHDKPSKANLPAQVTIPVGQASVTFQATAIDDSVYNDATVVNVIASSVFYGDVLGSFIITDFEAIGLAFTQDKVSEANETATLIVRRLSESYGQPVSVTLRTDRGDKVQLPGSVVIPAGSEQVTVQLKTLDNRLLDGLTQVHVTAIYGAPGQAYAAGTALIDVTDHEALSLTLTPPVLSERVGRSVGRLTRSNTDLDLPLTVELVASHPALVALPTRVTIPAGSEYIEFEVDAIDNDQLLPDTRVRLEAIHPAYLPEAVTFLVTDYEPLSLTLSATEGREGQTLVGTVTRSNSNLDQPATVLLISADESEAVVPAGIVIPAGEPSISFSIQLLQDRNSDGPQSVEITAQSVGYISSLANLTVNDYEFISVQTVDRGPFSESSGAILARLTRSDWNSEFPLTIQVSTSDSSIGYLNTQTLQIDAHQTSIEFPVFIADDPAVEVQQNVRLNFDVLDHAIDPTWLDLVIEDDDFLRWNNPTNALDVNNSGSVTPLDALLVINHLNRFGAKPVDQLPPADPDQPLFVDTSNDQHLSAIDALLIINFINSRAAAEGEFDVSPLSRRALAGASPGFPNCPHGNIRQYIAAAYDLDLENSR